MKEMIEVVGVYNAEGSISGELRYVLNKLRGRGSCGLCDITHGWSPRMKRSWREACARSELKVTLLHLDELDDEQRAALSAVPVFIQSREGRWITLMEASDIERYRGEPDRLLTALTQLAQREP